MFFFFECIFYDKYFDAYHSKKKMKIKKKLTPKYKRLHMSPPLQKIKKIDSLKNLLLWQL